MNIKAGRNGGARQPLPSHGPGTALAAARSVLLRTAIGVALGGVVAVMAPASARACGGLFCNARPVNPFAPLPVAQTGENIVFSINKDPAGGATKLTAEIQISYAGDAAQFSWVVPVDAAPTLSVGTDQLFTALAGVTQPTFNPNFATSGVCIPDPNQFNGTKDATAGGGPGFSGSGGSTGAAVAPTVTVAFHGAVGPYDAAVIQSTDPVALKNWLSTNGYVVSDQAGALIDFYVSQGKFFVALRLLNGDVKTIQPIVLDFIGTEPCVPLRLTAIAANADMQVRLWVLGDKRVVPRRFYEFKIDEARIDWMNRGANYSALVAEAANAAPGGQAFVTEYAGTASVAQNVLWSPGRFDLTGLQAAMTPPVYVQQLISLGLASDSQMLPLLAMYIPMPAALKAMGLTDVQFYGNLATYYAQYAFPPFDLATLTTQISAKIIEPRHTAQTMIDGHSYLTRLNTFISPEEMNEDPLFITNRDLGDVPLAHTATFRTICGNRQFMACNAPVRLELADGRMAWVRPGSTASTCVYPPYDLTNLQTLPAAEFVWQRDDVGEGMRVVDKTVEIQAGLMLNNNAFPAAQNMFPIPTATKGVTTQSGGGGCACAVGAVTTAGGLALGAGGLALGGLAVLLGRRRRAPRRPA